MKKIIGFVLLALPFLAITFLMAYEGGWGSAALTWVCVSVICGMIFLGIRLIAEGGE